MSYQQFPPPKKKSQPSNWMRFGSLIVVLVLVVVMAGYEDAERPTLIVAQIFAGLITIGLFYLVFWLKLLAWRHLACRYNIHLLFTQHGWIWEEGGCYWSIWKYLKDLLTSRRSQDADRCIICHAVRSDNDY